MHKLNEMLENYCEKIEKELGDLYIKINKTDTLSTQDLDAMDKLLHALKSTKTVWAMIEYGDGYSGSRYPDNGYSGTNRHYSNDVGYRSIQSLGRSNDYSRDTERGDMIRKLENMINRTRTDAEAMVIRDAIDTINHMG